MLDRKLRRRVERAFYEYKEFRQQGAAQLVELAESGLTARYGGVGGGGSGNPTEGKALKAAEGSDAVLWCRVVEKTLEHFRETGKDTLIRLKYFEHKKEKELCDKLYITRGNLYFWVDDILTFSVMIALQFQIVRIF